MAASRRTLRAVLDRSTRKELAQVLGVSASTITRWDRGGKIPPEKLALLPRALRAAKARDRETAKALRSAPEALATIYGVSVRTAKGWQARGSVPPQKRGVIPLLESETRGPAPKQLGAKERFWEKGRLTKYGVAHSSAIEAYLDPALARSIIEWAAGLPDRVDAKTKRYQFTLEISAPEEFMEGASADRVGSPTNTAQYKKRDGKWKRGDFKQIWLSTASYENKARMLSELQDILDDLDDQGVYIVQAIRYVKVPK